MTQDKRFLPVSPGRRKDTSLPEIARRRSYAGHRRALRDTNVREYTHTILKRKWLILGMVFVITSLVSIQAYREQSIYQCTTTIRIESKPPTILQTGGTMVIYRAAPNLWNTQLQLLRSPGLARQVILTLNLQNNPEFLSGQANRGIFASLKRILGRGKSKAPSLPEQSRDPRGEKEMAEWQLTAEQLAALAPYEDAIVAGVTTTPVEKTNLVEISFVHANPEIAKRIADTLADVFVRNNSERQEIIARRAEVQLAKEIDTYRAKVKRAREDRFEFAKANNLPLPTTTLNLEAVKERGYAQQLLAAENERREAKAVYEAAQTEDDPLSNPAVQKDEYIRKLRSELIDLKQRREALLQIYTSEWPDVKKIDAQIKFRQEDLKHAPAQVLESMKKRAEAAEAKANSWASAYAQQHGRTTTQTKAEIDLEAMTKQLTTDEQYLKVLYQKQRELSVRAGMGGSSVSIAAYSRVPRGPIGPQRWRSIVLVSLLSLVAGVGLAFLLDFLDHSVKSRDDIDHYIHLPTLALIPAARHEKRVIATEADEAQNASRALALVSDMRSPAAEAYRHLRTALLLSSAGAPPKTILVTSSQASEGKTTTAINTAFMLAQTGAQVLLIDCDLRRPRLRTNLNLAKTRGLTNYLSGECQVDDVLQNYDKVPNLRLLTSGTIPPNPAELLGSEKMCELLRSLSERFTHIVVDSPPVISFTDAAILSTFVDGVILVIHAGRTSRPLVRRARQQLLGLGANIFGVVLNNVNIQSHGYSGARYQTDCEGASTAVEGARAAT